MPLNENENPLQNSIENRVLKEIEKKVQNSDHNVTKSNVDDNKEFFMPIVVFLTNRISKKKMLQ